MAASSCRIKGEGAASIAIAGAGAAVVTGVAARSGVATSLTLGKAATGRGGGAVASDDGVVAAITDGELGDSTDLTTDVDGGAGRGVRVVATGEGEGFAADEGATGDATAGAGDADEVTVGSALATVLSAIAGAFASA